MRNLLVALHPHGFEGDDGGDILSKQVVLEVEAAVLVDDSCARFLLVCRRGDLRAQTVVLRLNFDDYAVFGHLFLDQDHLFDATNDKIAAWIVGTLFSD